MSQIIEIEIDTTEPNKPNPIPDITITKNQNQLGHGFR